MKTVSEMHNPDHGVRLPVIPESNFFPIRVTEYKNLIRNAHGFQWASISTLSRRIDTSGTFNEDLP